VCVRACVKGNQGLRGLETFGVTVFKLLSHVATVIAVSLVIATVAGWRWGEECTGADWGRESGGGETETRRAAEEPRPVTKRDVAPDDTGGCDDDERKRLGCGARGDCERRWFAEIGKRVEMVEDRSGGGAWVQGE
jgi:hypothetical protein